MRCLLLKPLHLWLSLTVAWADSDTLLANIFQDIRAALTLIWKHAISNEAGKLGLLNKDSCM